MKRLLLTTCAALGLATGAHASLIPVLDSVIPVGTEFEFSYSGTLAGDQGLIPGSELIIFDFLGYVAGSITPGAYGPDLSAFTELTSPLPPPPGEDDDPTILNLVFRWTGSPFQVAGGPYPDLDFSGLTARSTYGGVGVDGYAAKTVTNNGKAAGLLAFNSGEVGVPTTVPEPATWAMLILGFGGAGLTLRLRRRRLTTFV
ncbi:MAG: PEPxxWA-CTERM sorting domain-containing protein [Caulobacterales bacterium]|nr:PEPxxWA-CTERM sorting domain-containing protein [Caulobacterales bacterium]